MTDPAKVIALQLRSISYGTHESISIAERAVAALHAADYVIVRREIKAVRDRLEAALKEETEV